MTNINSENIIIVPVNVQAICIGKADAQNPSFIKRNIDFSLLPYRDGNQTYNQYANISEHILNKPFSSDRHAMPEGIHLHWALPDAFTHGEINNTISQSDFIAYFEKSEALTLWNALVAKKWLILIPNTTTAKFNNISLLPAADQTLGDHLKDKQAQITTFLDEFQMSFPNVPNRWLITRIIGETHRSWVIESDYLSSSDYNKDGLHNNNTTVPFNSSSSPKSYRYMGKSFEYSSWAPKTDVEYYHKLTAIGYGDIEFSGYYPNCSSVFGFHDDLKDLTNADDLTKVSYQISGWYSNSDYFKKDPFQKSYDTKSILDKFKWSIQNETTVGYSIYSGMVTNLEWSSNKTYISTEQLKKVDIAFAPNEKEALSALTSNDNRQRLFNAFQMGIEAKLDNPEGLFEIEKAIHDNRFTKYEGGYLWNIRNREEDTISPPTDQKELPVNASKNLTSVNKCQELYNDACANIISIRQRLFADWCKYMTKKYDQVFIKEMQEDTVTFSEIRQFIENTELKKLTNALKSLKDTTSKLTTKLKTLENILKGSKYIINRTTSPVYYQGNDPVILFKPDDSDTQWQYAGNRNEVSTELLTCRLSTDILNKNSVPSILPDNVNVTFYKVMNALVNETQLFDSIPYSDMEHKVQVKEIHGKIPEKIAVTEWKEDSRLVMQLHWKVDYSALKTSKETGEYKSTYITKSFQFNFEQSELELKAVTMDKFDQTETLEGKCLLTPYAKENLLNQIDKNIGTNEENETLKEKLKSLRLKVSSSSIFSQSLTGFNDALVMKNEALQLKVNDPLRAVFDDSFNTMMQNAISNENITNPLPLNQYNPIRSGLVKVNSMRVVDSFGRFQDINASEVDVSYSREMTLKTPIVNYTAFMPPRITQPSRLLFDYINANSSNKDSEIIRYNNANPVCGWILLNLLENSFMIYDYDGTALGSLRKELDDSTATNIIWLAAPGKDTTTIDNDLKEANKYLGNFAKAIHNNGTSFFDGLLHSIEKSQQFINMESYHQDQGIAPLIGEPIALVRANLSLELQGLPEINQSWSALKEDIQNQSSLRSTNGFKNVDFPFIIGKKDILSDGLYGFFKGDDRNDFDKFYTNSPVNNDSNISNNTQITLNLNQEAVTLSMLVQPNNPVHVNSGILPEKFVQLPLEYCVDAINKITVTFLASPIVIHNDDLRIPLSKQKGWEWSFISKKSKTWQNTNDILDESNNATYSTSKRSLLEGWIQLSKESKKTLSKK